MTRISRGHVTRTPVVLAFTGALAVGSAALAFVRLATDTGTGLSWASQPVLYCIQRDGSEDVPDASEDVALRISFDTWQRVETTSLRFQEDLNAGHRALKTHANDGVNLVFFDETNATGFFGGGSYVIAITPVFYDGSGHILDADIVFNGSGFSFSTELSPGTYDIQNIATHEIGHFVGLDHTAVYGATLIPFAFPQETRLRSLASDDRAGVSTAYPSGIPFASVFGQVLWNDTGLPVNGAHVVAANADSASELWGEPASSAIGGTDGRFQLLALKPGTYHVYVEPFDGPTTDSNLQRNNLDVGFETVYYNGSAAPSYASGETPTRITLAAGQTLYLPAMRVNARSGFNLQGATPRQVVAGTAVTVSLSGTGLQSGQGVEVPGKGITASPTLGSGASFQLSVAATAPTGLHDVYVYRTVGGLRQFAALPGGIEVIGQAPVISGCVPSAGPATGGEQILVTGSHFEAGARVIFGDQLAPQVVWQDPETLQVLTPACAVGAVRVTVINPDGQQARREAAYVFLGMPSLSTVSPAQGPSAGGVPVVIRGSQFATGVLVYFGEPVPGNQATNVVVSEVGRRIDCTTPRGALGPVDVIVQNPGPSGGSATLPNAYTFIDPRLDSLSPSKGSSQGGTVVSLTGDGLSPGMRVEFGTRQATSVEFVTQYEVRATTPASPVGTVNVTAIAADGRSDTVLQGFSFVDGVDPDVYAVTPNAGPTGGGTPIIVTGNYFVPGATVLVGGKIASQVVFVSSGEVRATTPSNAAGPKNVTVRNPNGLEGTLFGGFTYEAPGKVIASGSSGGGGGGCAFAGVRLGAPGAFGSLAPYLLGVVLAAIIRRRGTYPR